MIKRLLQTSALVLLLSSSHATFASEENFTRTAVEYSQNGNYVRAFEYYDKALKNNPSDPEIFVNRGSTYELQGKHAEALADEQKAIAILEKQKDKNVSAKRLLASAYSNRAAIQMNLGSLKSAKKDFLQALILDYGNATAHEQLGEIYYKQGKQKLALSELTLARSAYEKMLGFKHVGRVDSRIRQVRSGKIEH